MSAKLTIALVTLTVLLAPLVFAFLLDRFYPMPPNSPVEWND